MTHKPRNTRRTADQWQSLVEQQQKSGLSGASFCKSEGIAYQSFMSWRKRLESASAISDEPDAKNPKFIELTQPLANIEKQEPHWHIELDLAPGVQLRIAR